MQDVAWLRRLGGQGHQHRRNAEGGHIQSSFKYTQLQKPDFFSATIKRVHEYISYFITKTKFNILVRNNCSKTFVHVTDV